MIEIEHVSKNFGEKVVLRDVSATIQDGEIFAIIGPSGSGKSTLLRMINLLEIPDGGRIIVDGTDIHADRWRTLEIRRMMAMVFQKPAAFNESVYDNIAIGLRMRHVPEREIQKKIADALEVIGLSGYEKRRAKTLSGGEMQRVALARALVTDPAVLLMDEPTANLDPLATAVIEDLVLRINRDFGQTVVISTHDMLQGQRLAHRIGVLMDGVFSQVGTPREVFALPKNKHVARFVGIENIVSGRIARTSEGVAEIESAGVIIRAVTPLSAGRNVCACIKPEDITLHLVDGSQISARNVLDGTIARMTAFGPLTRLTVECGIPFSVLITWKSAGEMGIAEGSRVRISFKASAVHVVEDAEA
ncbi:ABC transporter related protein [Methanofollis liminatans DSM 4140]|jgi:tungstate transport system ATP-binding protein|uniref:Molybdate/tungstate import ATP-binding protein WtpC n=1 Tax=Methanofollis liminatans DSM 4140 TaxID=28892 RepID=J0S7L2_9EURY|nr:ABC transporter ATP-binding protein [Methanofollis liminatans]EJG06529.1 ABC transporter related protein [Methanofollis liminatans DSM 4140]